jgi:endoglucanase
MLLKKLTDANGMPGFECEVREIIKEEIKHHVDEMYVDRMGNLIAVKNKDKPGRHLAISAHMDEVGLCITHIDGNGYLKFYSWGVDARILPAKIVKIGKNKITGVIGTKAIHLQAPGERANAIAVDALYIDIGANSKEEAEGLVEIGDYVAFDSEYTEFGSKIKAKALDDRVGCLAMIEALKSDYPHKLTACFNVQEEVGLRGSAITAYQIHADLVLNLEGTISADTMGIEDHQTVNIQGNGPSVSLMDRGSIYLKKYANALVEVAEKNNIPYQLRRSAMGGTDAANYHTAHGGTPVIGLAVPCRYIHSPVSVVDKADLENFVKLTQKFMFAYGNGEVL